MLNLVVLVGRLCHDCETTKTREELKDMCKFTLACQPNKNVKAEFIDCITFEQSATFLGTYGKKGMLFLVIGRIHKTVIEQDGRKIYRQTVTAEKVTALETRRDVDGYQREVIKGVGEAILNDEQYTGIGSDPDYPAMYGGGY